MSWFTKAIAELSGTFSAPVVPHGYASDGSAFQVPLAADKATGALLVENTGSYPLSAVPVTGTSGVVANASAAATLTAVAGKTTYITGFEVTGSGATAGLPVSVTVTGLLGGTLTYSYCAAVGALVANQPLIVQFSQPIPASAQNTSIVVTCPALGAGNTQNCVVAHGYNL